MKKVTLITVMLAFLLVALSACGEKVDFAVKVNGKVVPMTAFNQKMEAVKAYFKAQGMDLTASDQAETLENVEQEVVEGLISTELMAQEAVNNKWNLADPEVTKQIEELKTSLPEGTYQEWLKEQAMTDKEVQEFFAFTYFVGKDVTVTEQEIREFFDVNFAMYGGQEEQVKARQILVDTEAEAQALIDQLKAGADFITLAKEKSTEPGASESGGDLGYFSKGQTVAPFEEAAFTQKVNTYSEKPVKSDFGYHVILVEDHKQAVKPDFTTVKDQVSTDTLENAKNMKRQSRLTELREKAKLEYAEKLKPAQ